MTQPTVQIYLTDRASLDIATQAAADNSARITIPAAEIQWGAYYERLVDPFDHSWSFAAE